MHNRLSPVTRILDDFADVSRGTASLLQQCILSLSAEYMHNMAAVHLHRTTDDA